MLAFERHPLRGKGVREALAMRLWPELTATRYHQLLFALSRRPEAEAAAPDVVRRLRARRKDTPRA